MDGDCRLHAPTAQGKWSARITPCWSFCLKCHLCWLVLGSSLMLHSPFPLPLSLSQHTFGFSFLLITIWNYSYPRVSLFDVYLNHWNVKFSDDEGKASCPGILSQTRTPYLPLPLAKRFFPSPLRLACLPTAQLTQFTQTERDVRNVLPNVKPVSSWMWTLNSVRVYL